LDSLGYKDHLSVCVCLSVLSALGVSIFVQFWRNLAQTFWA